MSEVRDLMSAQRNRLVATIMGELERVNLRKDQQDHLRNVVIGAANRYHDLALDVLRVYATDKHLINEEVLPLLRSIHMEMTRGGKVG